MGGGRGVVRNALGGCSLEYGGGGVFVFWWVGAWVTLFFGLQPCIVVVVGHLFLRVMLDLERVVRFLGMEGWAGWGWGSRVGWSWGRGEGGWGGFAEGAQQPRRRGPHTGKQHPHKPTSVGLLKEVKGNTRNFEKSQGGREKGEETKLQREEYLSQGDRLPLALKLPPIKRN